MQGSQDYAYKVLRYLDQREKDYLKTSNITEKVWLSENPGVIWRNEVCRYR